MDRKVSFSISTSHTNCTWHLNTLKRKSFVFFYHCALLSDLLTWISVNLTSSDQQLLFYKFHIHLFNNSLLAVLLINYALSVSMLFVWGFFNQLRGEDQNAFLSSIMLFDVLWCMKGNHNSCGTGIWEKDLLYVHICMHFLSLLGKLIFLCLSCSSPGFVFIMLTTDNLNGRPKHVHANKLPFQQDIKPSIIYPAVRDGENQTLLSNFLQGEVCWMGLITSTAQEQETNTLVYSMSNISPLLSLITA